MSSEQPRRSRDNNAGSPMGSTAAIVIAIIAVVAGFLILREIRSDDTAASSPATTTSTTVDPALTTTSEPAVTSTTVPPIVTEGATVVVANASGVDGAAGVLTTALSGKNFTLAQATNGSERREATVVYYDESNPSALPVATSIAQLMGPTVTVQVMPSPAPVQGGTLPEGVTVLVMLASDKATQKLDDMATTTTLAGAAVPAIDTTSTAAP
jgi:hypothetical protein